ncbi:hypothetical protein MJM59_31980, partial [Salmonella enterica subsp. enterica serovar Montevideo]|nr:hypothetical protein [Salmonella enterica subsp. enterica serovar Montevideo]
FGPDSGSLAKQVVVWCDGRQPEAYQWFLEQIQVWGARLHRISRYLHPAEYKRIAKLLHERRLDREHYIEEFVGHLRAEMKNEGV